MLFDDTSSGAPQVPNQGYYNSSYNMSGPAGGGGVGGPPMGNIFNDPMANVAMAYGSSFADKGRDMVNKEVGIVLWNALERLYCHVTQYNEI